VTINPVSPAEFALLLAAGIVGGLTGSIAGLASLATYPALLAVGLAPVSANVTNTVALVFTGVGTVGGTALVAGANHLELGWDATAEAQIASWLN